LTKNGVQEFHLSSEICLSDGQEGVPELPLWGGGAQCGGGGKEGI
jgi:hypothetical protein